MHGGGLRCGGAVMDRFVGLGRAWVLAHRPGPRREVLQAVLLGRSNGGKEAVRLQSEELVHVGPIRRGAGPSPPSRSTVAMVVSETPMPSFRSSPRILR